jgi:hypothetical protein
VPERNLNWRVKKGQNKMKVAEIENLQLFFKYVISFTLRNHG